MYFPADINKAEDAAKLKSILKKQALKGNNNYKIKGLRVEEITENTFDLTLVVSSVERIQWLKEYFEEDLQIKFN